MKIFTVSCCDWTCPSTIEITVSEDRVVVHGDGTVCEDETLAQFIQFMRQLQKARWVNDYVDLDDDGRLSPDPYGPTGMAWKCPFCVQADITVFCLGVAYEEGKIH
jgi:hypothetical protein